MVRPSLSLVLLATGCPVSMPTAEDALEAVSSTDGIAYPDSWFEGRILVREGWHGDLRCRWIASGLVVGQGAPDAAGNCTLDGLEADIPEGAWMVLRAEALRDGAVVDQQESAGLFVRPFPVGAVTEMALGSLAFLDTEHGEVSGRLDLIEDPDVLGLDATTSASALAGLPMQVLYTPEHDRLLVTSSSYGVIWEIDPQRREILGSARPTTANYWIAFSQDGNRLYMTDREGGGVALLDRDYRILAAQETGTGPVTLYDDASSGRLYVSHHESPWISVLDDKTLESVGRIDPARGSYWVTAGPDGDLWVVTEFDDSVSVYDRHSGALLDSGVVGDLPNFVHFLGDGDEAYVTSFHDGEMLRIDTRTLAPLRALDTATGSVAILPRPDGRFVYVPNVLGGSISVIDTRTDTVVDMIYGLRGPRWIQWLDP